jgi:hypothetical protein
MLLAEQKAKELNLMKSKERRVDLSEYASSVFKKKPL